MAGNGAGTESVVIARPVVNLAGQDSDAVNIRLLHMLIVESTQGLYRCEVGLGNWGEHDGDMGYRFFDRRVVDFGKAWKIKAGPEADAPVLFEGRITGLEARFPSGERPFITVLAEDRFQDLRMTRRTRTFENVSDSDVMNRLASDHGLQASIQVRGPTYKVLAQLNQSDLAFLRERARACDAELWMEGSTLHAQPRSGRRATPFTLTYPGNLREFTALADLAQQHTSLTVGGWDVAGKQGLKYEATDSLVSNELNGGDSGASILRSALGARKETVVHTVPLSSAETQATAESLFRAEARRFVTGQGVAAPDPRLRVGATVDLQGLGPLFNGKYYVAVVQHIFDNAGGLRTEFMVERPGLGRP